MKNFPSYALHTTRKKGFTLIELLVVIAIMGTLVAIVLPNFIGGRQKSKDTRRRLDIESISSALELYRSTVGSYPNTIDLNCDTNREALTYDPGGGVAATTFMTTIPQDPGCSSISYAVQSMSATDYSICAYLEASTPATPPNNPNTDCGGQKCNYCKGPFGAK
jgi:general secretion pathway protein G